MSTNKTDRFLVKRNVFYRLKDDLLVDKLDQRDFSFHVDVTNEKMSLTNTDQKRFDFANNNIVYDFTGHGVTIKRNGFVVDSSNYTINYWYGYIEFTDSYINSNPFDASLIDRVTADYTYLPIRVDLAFRADKDVTEDDLPIIAIHFEQNVNSPWELGSTTTAKGRSVFFDVYARTEVELDYILSLLENEFVQQKEYPVFNYKLEEPLDDDGFLNSSFTGQKVDGYTYAIEFVKTEEIYPSNNLTQNAAMIETNVFGLI